MNNGTQTRRSIRTRMRRTVELPIRALHILLLSLLWIGYELICRVRSWRRVGGAVQVPRIAAAEVNLAELMRGGRPVVIEGLAEQLGLEGSLALASVRAMSATVEQKFPVKHYKPHSPYFLYTGDYGRELDHTSEMSLADFLRTMFDEKGPDDLAVYQLFEQHSLGGEVGSLIESVSEGLARVVDDKAEASASGLWIGSKGVVTPLHHDCWQGLLFQLHGSKRVLMFAPVDGSNLYLTSPFSIGNRFTELPGRYSKADPASFPHITRATRHEAHLHGGEALFIPPFWLHEVEALEPNISMPYRFKLRLRDCVHPRSLRAMCESLHARYLAEPAPSE